MGRCRVPPGRLLGGSIAAGAITVTADALAYPWIDIAHDNSDAADQFLEEIDHPFVLRAENPRRGRAHPDRTGGALATSAVGCGERERTAPQTAALGSRPWGLSGPQWSRSGGVRALAWSRRNRPANRFATGPRTRPNSHRIGRGKAAMA